MNSLFKEANLNSAFSIASEIIKLVSDENFDIKLDEFLCLEAISHDEFITDMLNANLEQLLKPKKETLLHIFISRFFSIYLNNEFYYFSDGMFDTGEFDVLNNFFEEIKMMFDDNGLNTLLWEEKIENLLDKLEKEAEKDEPQMKPLENMVQSLLDEMQDIILSKIDTITENTFLLLYSNKKFLYDFNLMISKYVSIHTLPTEMFDESKHIIRYAKIPKWLENAILFRDRATCQHCGADLSNSFRIMDLGQLHFDHTIPLEKMGTNDATNFQLLCSSCNFSKNDKLILPKYQYQMYW